MEWEHKRRGRIRKKESKASRSLGNTWDDRYRRQKWKKSWRDKENSEMETKTVDKEENTETSEIRNEDC